jgi:hypothetical protein
VRRLPVPEGDPGGYLKSFVASVVGDTANCKLSTEASLRANRLSLLAQDAALRNLSHVRA